MSELVSVIVPVYNVEKYITKCVDSILNQTYNNIEILLIDDGSLDNSPKICDEFAKKDRRIKVFHTKNGGVSKARNIGLANAQGEYILFVDSDDWLELNMIEIMYRELISHGVDISICNYFINYKEKIIIHDELNNRLVLDDKEKIINALFDEKKFGGYLWNKLISRKAISKIRFDEKVKICEDMLFLYEIIIKNNIRILYNSVYKLYHYRKSEYSAVNFNYSEKDLTKLIPLRVFMKNNILYSKILPDYFILTCQGIYIKNKEKKYIESKIMKLEAKKYFNEIRRNHIGLNKIRMLLWYYFPNICGKVKDKNFNKNKKIN